MQNKRWILKRLIKEVLSEDANLKYAKQRLIGSVKYPVEMIKCVNCGSKIKWFDTKTIDIVPKDKSALHLG